MFGMIWSNDTLDGWEDEWQKDPECCCLVGNVDPNDGIAIWEWQRILNYMWNTSKAIREWAGNRDNLDDLVGHDYIDEPPVTTGLYVDLNHLVGPEYETQIVPDFPGGVSLDYDLERDADIRHLSAAQLEIEKAELELEKAQYREWLSRNPQYD